VRDFTLGAEAPASIVMCGRAGRPSRMVVGVAVFLFGVAGGAVVAAWIVPPV
jgi:hypothetical protein